MSEMSIKELFTLIGNRLNLTTDYVVERGTSGDWTYCKWNSGFCEMWGAISYSGITCNTSSSGTYYNDTSGTKTITVPIITNIQNIIMHEQASQTSGIWAYRASASSANLTTNFRAHASQSNAVCAVAYYLTGTWK